MVLLQPDSVIALQDLAFQRSDLESRLEVFSWVQWAKSG
jgi:hypothetical protein